ncbi:carbohydrate kinase family protein [Haloparvum sedimenti]|uniref:carbohydrate kinase family protein n=1 Tax=Haloparvum sedimenti TaxID=1678448 RepID=UPI00071E8AEC|nr:carbohydrate kinase [Haloparvum sedimenti]
MQQILVAGETLVDFIPEEPGPLDEVETFHRRAGGAPANVAVGLARLGRPPAFWTRVGTDPFGDFLADALADAGVPTEHVERDPDAKTGLAFVSLDPDADRAFSFHRDGSADTRMEPGGVDGAALADTDWVHAGGVTLADEPARTATLDLLARAREADATVSFDPNARPELWTDFDFPGSCREAFALADVVKVSPEDLDAAGYDGAAVDESDPASATEVAAAVAADGPHTVLVTLGGAGAFAYATPDAPWNDGDEPLAVDHGGYDAEPVDTTGAGDAFTAGAVAALSAGESLAEALAFANAVAARTTTEKGAMTALPDRDAVAALRGE